MTRAAIAGGTLLIAGLIVASLLLARPPDAPTDQLEPIAAFVPEAVAAAEQTTQDVSAESEPVRRKPPVSTHQVADGESLRDIAAQYGLSVETLIAANALHDPDLLRLGQQLVVPVADGVLHTVLQGDTLRSIAQRYGVQLDDLIDVNDLRAAPDTLTVGTLLVVPGARSMVRAPEPAPAPVGTTVDQQMAESPESRSDDLRAAEATRPAAQSVPAMYTVREGDTLRSIAQAFDLDLLSLIALNGLAEPDLIRPGRALRITPNSTLEHIVQPGETLADIAWRYSVAAAVVLEANGIVNADRIVTGAVLVVPGAQPRAVPTAVPPPVPIAKPAPTRVLRVAPPAAAPPAGNSERVITAKVTGYALGAGAVSTRTASGTTVHWGTVAADIRLYPFGTRLRIQGYPDTVFVVEDTGSAVRGNIFDIWFPDAASARRLGAQTRQVTLLP